MHCLVQHMAVHVSGQESSQCGWPASAAGDLIPLTLPDSLAGVTHTDQILWLYRRPHALPGDTETSWPPQKHRLSAMYLRLSARRAAGDWLQQAGTGLRRPPRRC